MTPLAHIAGVPVEECLPFFGPAGATLVVARVWLALQLRRRKDEEE
jgi:hypothetical protein